jgi:NAD(P)-dependent dehydrogenase (short-subunit alcohol dehydrogenase family)
MDNPLAGKVALVAGGTRAAGRGIAVQLGAAGATVYCTGRTTRTQRSEMNRPETIEETAELVDEAGGKGVAVQVDHLVPEQVRDLVARIEREQGALHVLVNDIWGATTMEWNKTVWESTLDIGLRTLRLAVDTHAITSHFAIPLLIRTPGGLVVEVTDGTDEYNATHYRVSFFYDLAKAAVNRMAWALAHELKPHGATAVSDHGEGRDLAVDPPGAGGDGGHAGRAQARAVDGAVAVCRVVGARGGGAHPGRGGTDPDGVRHRDGESSVAIQRDDRP